MTKEICYNCKGRGHGDGDMRFFICPCCKGSGVLESAPQSEHWTLCLLAWLKKNAKEYTGLVRKP